MSPVAEIKIFNETDKSELDILSVSSGYIKNEKVAVSKNNSSVDGYINLFNKDKTNKHLRGLHGVELRCNVKRTNLDGSTLSDESEVLTFYNQSQSLDGSIVPFDVSIINPTINISEHEPLVMDFTCGSEDRFELAVRSENGMRDCTFEIVTKPGVTRINLPSEILWSDLNLSTSNDKRKYNLYWVKFEGVNHMKFMNRKYIKIDDCGLSFVGNMTPQPTDRKGPTEVDLPDYFVLSHRYLVHTHKKWSEYGGDYVHNKKSENLSIFLHESQNMDTVTHAISLFENKKDSTQEVKNAIWKQSKQKQKEIAPHANNIKSSVLHPLKHIYSKKIVETMSVNQPTITQPAQSPKKSGGCGCSRKKNG